MSVSLSLPSNLLEARYYGRSAMSFCVQQMAPMTQHNPPLRQ